MSLLPRDTRGVRDVRGAGPRLRAVAAISAATLLASAIALVPSSPRAQTAVAPKGTGTLADAKTHMDKGQALFLEKKFAEAAEEFRKAYEIKPLSTFLFNEAVCHEKLRDWDAALTQFRRYLEVDETAPDRQAVKARIEKIEKLRDDEKAAAAAAAADAGDEAGDEAGGALDGDVEAGAATDAATDAAPTAPSWNVAASIDEMRSIVVVESLPDGAPVEIWERTDPAAAKFVIGGANAGWKKVVSGTTTLTQSLPLGTYHVVIPKFQDYRATETDVTVAAATISQFKANLAQGAFFGVMKLRSFAEGAEVRGAHVFVKKEGDAKWVDRGVTPYEESLESGKYEVRVELPGFRPKERSIEVVHGRIDEQKLELERSDDGLIRVEVAGADAAEVIVDDHVVGTWTPGARIEAPVRAGAHRVAIKADDKKTYTADVDVPKGKMVVVHAELKPKVPRGAAWSTAVASAVFLGAGVWLGLQSNDLRDELDAARAQGRLDQEDPRIKRGQYFAIGANAAFAVGGVLALISVYNFVKDPLPPSKGWSESPRDLDALPAAPRPVAWKLVPIAGPEKAVGNGPTGAFAGLSLVGAF